jgi:hypothetical protein
MENKKVMLMVILKEMKTEQSTAQWRAHESDIWKVRLRVLMKEKWRELMMAPVMDLMLGVRKVYRRLMDWS